MFANPASPVESLLAPYFNQSGIKVQFYPNTGVLNNCENNNKTDIVVSIISDIQDFYDFISNHSPMFDKTILAVNWNMKSLPIDIFANRICIRMHSEIPDETTFIYISDQSKLLERIYALSDYESIIFVRGT